VWNLPYRDEFVNEQRTEVETQVLSKQVDPLVRQVDTEDEGGNPHRVEDHESADLEVQLVPHKMPNLSFLGHHNSKVATSESQFVNHLGAFFRSKPSDVMLPGSIVESLKSSWVNRVRDSAGKEFAVTVSRARKLVSQVRTTGDVAYKTVLCAPVIAYLESSHEQQIAARLWQQAHMGDLLGDLTSSWRMTRDAVRSSEFKHFVEFLCSLLAVLVTLFCLVVLASLCYPTMPELPWWNGFVPREWAVDPLSHQSWLARWIFRQWGFSKGYVASDIIYLLLGPWYHTSKGLGDVTVAFAHLMWQGAMGVLGACTVAINDLVMAQLA